MTGEVHRKRMRKRRNKNEEPAPQPSKLELKQVSPLTDNQRITFEEFDRGKNLLLVGSAGTGKAQPLWSKVLMVDGTYKTMGELKIGDRLASIDGAESTITGVFQRGIMDVYKVITTDGRITYASGDHLWSVDGKIKTTVTINETRRKLLPNYAPIAGNSSVPIPYTLGAILGDGGITTCSVTITSADPEIIDEINNEIISIGVRCEKRINEEYAYCFKKIDENSLRSDQNPLTTILRRFGLMGLRSENKFIPEEYFSASSSDRLKMLHGLMDTDGFAGTKGEACFYTTSLALAQGVQRLVWSLGGYACIKNKQTQFVYNNEKKNGKPSYAVSVSLRLNPFSLPRKKNRINIGGWRRRIGIASIEYHSQDEVQCISVSHPSKLYITDDYIVTHNTFQALYLALDAILETQEYKKLIIIRSAQPTKDVGFMPGSLKEKIRVYEMPYYGLVSELFGRGDAYDILKNKNIIEFMSTSFIRGITLTDCVIVVDECQNSMLSELHTVMTRVGENCRIIFCGDMRQDDLTSERYKEQSGLRDFLKIARAMPDDFGTIEFTVDDICRSDLVKRYIIARTKLGYD